MGFDPWCVATCLRGEVAFMKQSKQSNNKNFHGKYDVSKAARMRKLAR
jgi:hypothetical protein